MAKWILDLYAYNYVDVVLPYDLEDAVLKKIKNAAAFLRRKSFIIHISLSNKEGSLYYKSHMNHFHYLFQFMTRLLKFFNL